LGDLAHQALAGLGERHHRGGGAAPLGVGDHHRLPALHHRHAGVGGPEIDSDDLAHVKNLPPAFATTTMTARPAVAAPPVPPPRPPAPWRPSPAPAAPAGH